MLSKILRSRSKTSTVQGPQTQQPTVASVATATDHSHISAVNQPPPFELTPPSSPAKAATTVMIETLGAFASMAPIPGIAGAVALVKSILIAIEGVRDNQDDLAQLIRRICFLLVDINTQAQCLKNQNLATNKYHDVVEQFTRHLERIKELCEIHSRPSSMVLALVNRQSMRKDIQRIDGEIDLAFELFCAKSMAFFNEFIVAWKAENDDRMSMILTSLVRNSTADHDNGDQSTNDTDIEWTSTTMSNTGTMLDLQGGFNTNKAMQDSNSPASLLSAMSGLNARRIKYTETSYSNSGYISNLNGGFNSNNLEFTSVNGVTNYNARNTNNGNGNTASNSVVIVGNSKKSIQIRSPGN